MKKLKIAGVILIAVTLVVSGVLLVHQESKSRSEETTGANAAAKTSKSNDAAQTKTACDLLDTNAAQAAIGKNATVKTSSGKADLDTKDSELTQCAYIAGNPSEAQAEISLTIHTSKTTLGARTNQIAFGSERPKNTTIVKGYGDAAFWDQSKGELNVLDDGNWYAFSVLRDASPGKAKLSDAEQLAKHVLGQL